MMGAEPTGLDATAFAFVGGVLCPLFAGERYDNLKRYVGRMTGPFLSGPRRDSRVQGAA